RVGDLQVDDVDVEVGGQDGDVGDGAGPVGHRHADLAEVGRGAEPGRQVDPGGPGLLERRQQRVPVAGGDDLAHVAQRLDELVEDLDDGGAVVVADVGPDAGVAGRDPGHVPEPAGRQPQQRPVLDAAGV